MHIFFSKDFSGELLQEPKEIAGLMRGLLTNKKIGFITLDHKARLYPGHKKTLIGLLGGWKTSRNIFLPNGGSFSGDDESHGTLESGKKSPYL